MAYTETNFRTKKALIEAVKAGQEVRCFQPGLGQIPFDGTITLEGPHYPEPHRWYAKATIENGIIVKVQ